jgi:hypothetical protein
MVVKLTHKQLSPEDLAAFEGGVQSLRNHNYNDVADFLEHGVLLAANHKKENTESHTVTWTLELAQNFFHYPIDNVERSVMLFHEYDHFNSGLPLVGASEYFAYTDTWNRKDSLGWTLALYGRNGTLGKSVAGTILWQLYQDVIDCINSHPNTPRQVLYFECGL